MQAAHRVESPHFLIGLVMTCGGFYLLLNSIVLRASFGFGYRVYSVGGFGITSGMIMIPFLFGVGMIFMIAVAFSAGVSHLDQWSH